jgi:hypothetical protein
MFGVMARHDGMTLCCSSVMVSSRQMTNAADRAGITQDPPFFLPFRLSGLVRILKYSVEVMCLHVGNSQALSGRGI